MMNEGGMDLFRQIVRTRMGAIPESGTVEGTVLNGSQHRTGSSIERGKHSPPLQPEDNENSKQSALLARATPRASHT